MAKTIRDTILAYPGLADCEDFLDNVVLPGRGFEGTEDSKTIDIQNKDWWLPTFIPWSVVCQTLPKTSFLSHIPVPGMMLWQNGCIGKVENRRKQN